MRFNTISPMLACGLGLAIPGHGSQASNIEAGPLFQRFSLTLAEGTRAEALGPLWYREQQGSQSIFALPPLFSHVRNPELDSEEIDFLYPVVTYDRHGAEYRLQGLQLLSFSGGHDQKDDSTRRFTLFPFVFTQRSADTNQNYTAVIPFGGRLEKRLFRDEVKFVMMPLWVQTRKKDVVTDNYLYPFFHRRHGDGLKGWQLWPFYGVEHKDITTRTNNVDEVETVGGHDKVFALWPLYAREKTGLGTESPATNQVALPFYYSQRSPQRDSTTYLWPLFTVTDDRAQKYKEYGLPWPFMVYTRGEGKTVNRVFPFYSHAYSTNMESGFYLWPLYKYNRFKDTAVERERGRVLYFLYSDITVKAPGEKTGLRQTDLWPLFSARKDEAGNERVQLLAPFEPIARDNPTIERNLSPVWSVWRSEKNGKTGKSSQSLLWNLYWHEQTPRTKKCSFLFGLFHYEAGPEGKRWRVCYIPLGKRQTAPGQPEASRK